MNRRSVLRLAVGLCVATALVTPVFAQTSPIKVDGKIIKGYITYMSTDDKLGRQTFTPGYEQVAEWAGAKFKEWGLEPAGENGSYFQKVPLDGPRSALAWSTGIPSLSIAGRVFYVRDNQFAVDARSKPGTKLNAQVVFVGYGISAPAKGLDEYAGIDVKGKIVVALKGSPSTAPAARPAMGSVPMTPTNIAAMMGSAGPSAPAPDEFADESTDIKKAMTAYEKGAAGIMLYTPPAASNPFGGGAPAAAAPALQMTRPQVPESSPFAKPFIFVSNIDDVVFHAIMWRDPQESSRSFDSRLLTIRSDIKGKKTRSTQTGVVAQLSGYTTTTFYNEKLKNNSGRNVIAKITGSDPALKAQYVITGGHLDHVGIRDGVIYNGADDNASGSAVVMEVARLLAVNKVRPKRTLIFCLWTGEEEGLNGSNYYVAHPTDGVTAAGMVAYFNMDMVGLGTRIDAPGSLNFPTIYDVIKKDQLPDVISSVDVSTAGPGGSDYSAFIERGIEALGLMTSGGGGHPDYHDSGDDPAKMEPEILAKTGQFVLQGMLNVANETTVNLVIADRQLQYDAQRFTAPAVAGNVERNWSNIEPSTTEDLIRAVAQRGSQPTNLMAMMRRGGPAGGKLATGVRSAGVFGGSVALLETSAAALNFGRVDVPAPDGVWFGDKVTPAGKVALEAMEKAGVTVHLVSPTGSLLSDVLAKATKPILVSGISVPSPDLAAKLKANKAVVVVNCDPADVTGCVQQIGAMQGAMGKDNLLISVGAGANRDDALKALFFGLAKAGWTKAEAYSATGVGVGGMMGQPANTNLSRFQAGARG
jgi:hypothetical protein